MPAKDQRKYQREWIAKRRNDWFIDKICVDCGSKENLELHHKNPKTKYTHRIWSWSLERREKELSKCVVKCHNCHVKTHRKEKFKHGIKGYENYGCRCDVCILAKKEKNKKYRNRKPPKISELSNANVFR